MIMASSMTPTTPLKSFEGLRKRIISNTDAFLAAHHLRLKIRRLPLLPEESKLDSKTSDHGGSPEGLNGSNTHEQKSSSLAAASPQRQFPIYHFVTRQKRHLTEQLLRNRSNYETEFNTADSHRNKNTPFVLKEMPLIVREHLSKMANDFDDPEFSGVWLSLHSPPFKSNSLYGDLVRSKIVGWALIEVLTTNERCLKAIWIHPELTAKATSDLLKGFLPRVVFEAFELVAPQGTDACTWKFFYSWLNDFDLFPRQTWLLLCSEKFFGLPKHFDTVADTNGSPPPGHVDDGVPPGSGCLCQKHSTWDDWEQVLVGCTELHMHQNMEQWLEMIPQQPSERLLEVTQALSSDELGKLSKLSKETADEIEDAEFFSMSRAEITDLLLKVYGKWGNGRVRVFSLEDSLDITNDENNKKRVLTNASNKVGAKRERANLPTG